MTACFMAAIAFAPVTAHADPPDDPETTGYSLKLVPLTELKLTLDLPRLDLSCPGCTVTPVTAGTTMTFQEDSIILSKSAAAQLLAWQDMTTLRFQAELDYGMGRVRNADVLYIRMLEDQARLDQQMATIRLAEVTTQRDIALKYAKRPWYEHPAFVATVAVVVTGAMAIGLNYGLHETGN
jgi:hypothetical protein